VSGIGSIVVYGYMTLDPGGPVGQCSAPANAFRHYSRDLWHLIRVGL
jgi:hypothetical protein